LFYSGEFGAAVEGDVHAAPGAEVGAQGIGAIKRTLEQA
jgi:hypothetical protein